MSKKHNLMEETRYDNSNLLYPHRFVLFPSRPWAKKKKKKKKSALGGKGNRVWIDSLLVCTGVWTKKSENFCWRNRETGGMIDMSAGEKAIRLRNILKPGLLHRVTVITA